MTEIKLCDFEVRPGQTCDAVVCVAHAHHVEPDIDYCPHHAPRPDVHTQEKGPMAHHTDIVHEVLAKLDAMDQPVSDWEAGFLESLLRRREKRPLSPKQQAILVRMAEQYLEPGLAAELRGQQRLFI